jgi:recombination protein RecT
MGKSVVNKEQQRDNIASVQQTLEKMKGQFANALPDHIRPERMVRVALTAVQNTPKLLECDRNSFYLAVLRAAQLGLEPDGILGQAYLIPYGKQVQLIPGYKGLIDLARRSGEVSNIIAKEVCKNDEFTVDFSQEIPFVHKPKLDGDRGDITHFWAMARFKDGGFHWDYLTKDEVIKIRDGSSGWKMSLQYAKRDAEGNITELNSPWHNHFVEMGKKTAIRRIAKFLPMSVQRAAVVEDLVDAGKKFTADQFGEIVIDGDEGNVIDATAEKVEEKTRGGKLDQFAGGTPHNPETGEVTDQAATDSSPPALSLQDWIDDIAAAPTAEGVDHKYGQASEKFLTDSNAMAQLTLAKTQRRQELAKPEEKAEVATGTRKLFEKAAKTESTAA